MSASFPFKSFPAIFLILGSGVLQAQDTLQAHWQFGNSSTPTRTQAVQPENPFNDCVDPNPMTLNNIGGWSFTSRDSETNVSNSATCFTGWRADSYIGFSVDVADDSTGSFNSFTFDISNYGYHSSDTDNPEPELDINQVELRVFKDGVELTQQGQYIIDFESPDLKISDPTEVDIWHFENSKDPGQVVDLTALNLDTGLLGGGRYDFRIFVTDEEFINSPRNLSDDPSYILLDHIRLNGDVCAVPVPEPSAVALLGLGGLVGLIRKRRA